MQTPLDLACSGGGGFTPCLTRQVTVDTATCGGADASLLAQQLDGRLTSVDSLRTATKVRLATIPSVDEALWDLGTFAFVASNLFSVGGRHLSAAAELIRLVESLEEIHTKARGVISSPHLATTLIYDVSQQWSLYLNRRVAVSATKALDAPGSNAPFSFKPILVEIEWGAICWPDPSGLTGRPSCGGGVWPEEMETVLAETAVEMVSAESAASAMVVVWH